MHKIGTITLSVLLLSTPGYPDSHEPPETVTDETLAEHAVTEAQVGVDAAQLALTNVSSFLGLAAEVLRRQSGGCELPPGADDLPEAGSCPADLVEKVANLEAYITALTEDTAHGCVLVKNGEMPGGYMTEGRIPDGTDPYTHNDGADVYCVDWANLVVDPCVHAHDLEYMGRKKYTLLVRRNGEYELLNHGENFDFRTPQGAYWQLLSTYGEGWPDTIMDASIILSTYQDQVSFVPDFYWATYDRTTKTIDWSNYPGYPASKPDGELETRFALLTARIDEIIAAANTVTYPLPSLCGENE